MLGKFLEKTAPSKTCSVTSTLTRATTVCEFSTFGPETCKSQKKREQKKQGKKGDLSQVKLGKRVA
jgi:hypothetical protein